MFERFYAENLTFRDNIHFLRRHSLATLFRQQAEQLEKDETLMATFEDDETRLEADIAAQGATITQVKAKLDDDSTQIETLKAEVATLQSQGVDTTRIEAALTALEANNTTLAGDLAPAATSEAAAS